MSVFRTNHQEPYFRGSTGENPSTRLDEDIKQSLGGSEDRWNLKVWSQAGSMFPQSDISLRRGAAQQMRSPNKLLQAQQSPVIVYETYVISALKSAKASGKNVNLGQIHSEALRIAARGVEDYAQSSLREGANRELDYLRSGRHLEENMRDIVGPRKTNITGDTSDYGVGEPARKVPSNPNTEYRKYQSVDGNEYVFRVAVTTNGRVRLDTLNVMLHALAEQAKGGSVITPLAAAGTVVKSSDGTVVCDFPGLLAQARAESDDFGDEIEPEAEFG